MKPDLVALLAAIVLLASAPAATPAVAAQPAAGASTARTSQTVPLPAPKASKAATPAGKPCHVGTFTGVMLPGSTVCMKVGGFVRAQTGSGGSARP